MIRGNQKGGSDEYYTPKYIFDALGCSFDLDVAAPEDRKFCHVQAQNFITSDSLDKIWNGFVWMNPPFSGAGQKELWLNKLHKHGDGIALTPDRTSAPWWPEAARKCDAVLFITGKVQFIKADGTFGGSPGNGTCLFAYGDKGMQAILRAEQNKLGVVLFKFN